MLALDLYRQSTAKHASRSFRFRRSLTAADWSEKVRRMGDGSKFRFSFAPYQREMTDTPFDPNIQATVYMMASRLGKTEVISNIIGHGISERPKRILVMYPTISQAEKWSKETLMEELVANTPELYDLIGDGTGKRKSGNTILHKMYPGGLISIFGANSPGEMRRAKGNLLCGDEIDAIGANDADEGDPLEIFKVRGSEYPDTIQIYASYPSIKGRSKIEAMMMQSDWRVWTMPCIHCKSPVVFHRRQLRYNTAEPEKAWIECPAQNCKITDQERILMVMAGEWVPTRPFRGIAGFHASRMISPHPVQKGYASHLHWAAAQEMAVEIAANRERAMRVLVNTFDGETYSPPEVEVPDPVEVEKGCYPYLRQVEGKIYVPDEVLVITCGADVQGDRVEAEVVGFGKEGQTWGLGKHLFPGAPDTMEPWEAFEKMLKCEFVRNSGETMRIVRTFVDSKYRPDAVRAWTRGKRNLGVFAVYGSTVLGRQIVSPPKRGRQGTLYEIGTNEAKSLIYQRARLKPAEDGGYPHGFQHWPVGFGYTSAHFMQLLCEKVELKKASDGDFYEAFSNPDKLRNEALDLRVYAMGAERSLNPRYDRIAEKYAGGKGE